MSTKKAPTITHQTTVRVTYRDTDQMGVVYYGNYPTWFEIGRTELLRATGTTYRDWEKNHGIYLPVVQCHLDYHHPARYDDLITIRTTVTHLTKATITFTYAIHHHDTDLLLVTGHTKHPFLRPDGTIARIADQLLPQWFKQ